MASNNIARLGVVLGLDTAAFTADIDKAIAETKNLKAAIQRESNAAAKEIVALKYATEDYGKEVSKVTQIEREIAAGRFKNASPALQQQLLAQAKAYDEVAKASKGAMSSGLSDQQRLALTYQTTDLVTQIASGQNALIALMQQGGQLKDQMGGIGPMFAGIRAALTPMVLGVTAAVAVFGTLGFAMYKGQQETKELNRQFLLTGGYAGLTNEKFYELANTINNKTNLAIGDTKDILMELMRSGKFAGDSIASVGEAISIVAKISGETASEVAQKLIPSFDGSASSAKALNDRMHFLTLEQYKQIVTLEKQNRLQEAQKVLADALIQKYEPLKEEIGKLETAWDKLRIKASEAWDSMTGLFRGPSIEKRIKDLTEEINTIAQMRLEIPEGGPFEQRRAGYLATMMQKLAERTRLEELLAKKDEETKKISDEAKFGEKRRQLAFDIDAAIVKNRYDLLRMSANDMMTIELNAQEKIFLARNEMAKKNEAERGVFAKENAQLLAQQVIQIEQDKNKQLRDLAKKRYADDMADRQKIADEVTSDFAQELTRRDQVYNQIVQSTQVEKESLEYEMQKLQVKQGLIGASDHALAVAMLELETQKKIAEIMANPDLSPEKKDLAKAGYKRNQVLQESFLSMQERLKETAQIYNSVFGNMERALENFVRTGKLSFKDLARSIIQDLILIQLKASATMLFNSFLRSIGFSFGSASGGTITGGSGLKIPPMALGGSVSSGTTYMVGEKGPELFVPRSSGTIIPNNALMSGGGGQVVNNYNIQAIDVKSFEERILGSSMAVWAANSYANKSLAIGRGRA